MTDRERTVAVIREALEEMRFDPHGDGEAQRFDEFGSPLQFFVKGTWIGDLADELFQHAAEAVATALEKTP